MGRLLEIVIAILLPLLIYAVYLALQRHRARLAGEGRLPVWADAPWTWIVIVMLLLFVVQLVLGDLLSIDPDDFIGGKSLIESN
jgi:hypothetical protein